MDSHQSANSRKNSDVKFDGDIVNKSNNSDLRSSSCEMANTWAQNRVKILNEVEALERLIKGHDQQNNVQELGDQVCDGYSRSDKCQDLFPLSAISHHVEIIHELINMEKTKSAFHQHNTEKKAEEVAVIESDSADKALQNSVVISPENQDGDDNTPSLSKEEVGASIESSQEQLNPLQIGSILEKVFFNLDVESIKNARQVNPLWSIEGAKMLMRKCYLRIPSYLHKKSWYSNEMDEFKAFLSHKSSDQSMIPNITIDKVEDVTLWKSLGVLGQQVESVKWNIIDEEAEMLQMLLDLLPNLKYLLITRPDPELCCYSTESRFDIIKALNSVMSAAEKGRSPLVISSIHLEPESAEELEIIEKFADCNNIMIEKLKCVLNSSYFDGVPNLWIRLSNLMSKLLSTSRNVLKFLTLIDCSFLHLLQFPSMPALTYLSLKDFSDSQDPLQPIKFSPCFRFSENVPNLNHFRLNWHNPQPQRFAHLFEQTGTAPSVKILKIGRYFKDVDVDFDIVPLFQTFPNIEEYEAKGSDFSQEMIESLWKYGANLRKLTIYCEEYSPKYFAELDAYITGFTPETVDKIQKTPNLNPYPLEEMEQLRVNPSILNLKNLEHLTIRFHCLWYSDVHLRFLATAGEYAFSLMPKDSKIFIRCDNSRWFRYDTIEGELFDEVSELPNVSVQLGYVL